jgi:uncharacterized delta-60 repeat protein
MRADAVAVQPDGRIVVGGWTEYGDFLLVRVNETGTLDGSFGGGYVTTDFDGQFDACHGLAIQPDGKIVAAGTARVGGDNDFAVARYLPGGGLDTSFGGDGKVTIGFGGDDKCWDVTLQDDGMVVLVGEYYDDWDIDTDFAVARLTPGGSLDDTFNGDGKESYGFDGTDVARAVAIQGDGMIVVAGDRDYGSDGALARLWSNGVPDASLDGDGKVIVQGSEGFEDVAVQPDGRIVTIGKQSTASEVRLAFHRILVDGTPDPTFGDGGAASFDLGAFDRGRNVALLPDGRILGHGTSDPGATCFIRLWQDGTLDGGGTTALGFPPSFLGPGSHERPAGMVVQPDGKFVVAGEVANADRSEYDFGVARFLPDGRPDLSFGTLGCATLDFHNADIARAVALQPDGKIVVAGHTGTGNVNFLVARFNADGTPDTGFGFSGFNVLDFLGGADYAQAVAIAPDGKIVLAGKVFNGARDVFGVCRFTSEGYADYDFDVDAKQLHELVFDTPHWVSSVVVQADRKIVLGGQANYDFALARYHESGAVDLGFGPSGQGFVLHDMGGNDFLGALLRAPDGRYFAAGSHEQFGNSDFALAQFSPDGVAGGTWIGGRAFIDFTGYDIAYAIDLRADGHVVAAGCGNGIVTWAQFNTQNTDPPHAGWTDLVGAGECAVGVRFVGQNHLVVAAIQEYAGDQNFALAKFETVPSTSPVAVEDPAAPASQFALRLHAAAPNPLADRTVIAFELGQAQPVRVRLYDAAGRLVRTLADGSFAAGRHQSEWDGRDDAGRPVAAGVYLVRAESGAANAQQKVILMR